MKSRNKLEEVVASLRNLDAKPKNVKKIREDIVRIREDIEKFLQETKKDPYRIKTRHGNVDWD